MDITVFVQLVVALTNLAIAMAEGQTPEQKKIIWDWWIKDITFWRKFFKIDQ